MATPHLDAFLDSARYFIGLKEINSSNKFPKNSKGAEMLSLYGDPNYCDAWCAVFVSACAEKAKIAGIVIGKDSYAIGVQKKTVALGGTWIDGPLINGGNPVTPQPGDIITFGDSGKCGHEAARHLGIVEYVEGDTVHTIEGNTSNECARRSYNLGASKINCYVRPDWSKVGDDVGGNQGITQEVTCGPLYETKNDRHDMTLRQVGYLDSNYKLSNNGSGIAISVINYTSVLGDIYDMFAPATLGTVRIDTSQLPGNFKIAMDCYLSLGYSASGASALIGCLYEYSKLNPEYIGTTKNNVYMYGIGAWEDSKLGILKGRSTTQWNTNLTFQLQYVNYDLYTNYRNVLNEIKSPALEISAVDSAVEKLITSYNPYFNNADSARNARNYANDVYNRLIITTEETIGNTNTYRDINGVELTAQYCIEIPPSVLQTGIIDDYTSYSHWYSKWNKKSPQKKLANLWGEQGFPCDKGVAKIGGYFCGAVRPKFGRCGELIEIMLEDGTTFPVIICDEKGEDAGSEWGHVKGGGKISLIEWERVKTENGQVITSGTKNNVVDTCGFSDWLHKKVVKITNYGKYTVVGWS